VTPYQPIAIIAHSFGVLLVDWFHFFKVTPHNGLIHRWFSTL